MWGLGGGGRGDQLLENVLKFLGFEGKCFGCVYHEIGVWFPCTEEVQACF